MSTPESDKELLTEIRVIRRFLSWGLGFVGVIFLVGMTDHFEQRILSSDSKWMKPRVYQLYNRFYPNSNPPEAASVQSGESPAVVALEHTPPIL